LGFLLNQTGEYAKALKYLTKALEKMPNKAQLWNDLGYTCSKLNKFTDAINCYQKALRIEPSNFDSYLELAKIYTFEAIDLEKSEYYIQKCISSNPNHPELSVPLRFFKANSIRKKILNAAKILPKHDLSVETLEVINYLETKAYTTFPYKFTQKYTKRNVPVYYDTALEMVYIVENDKKLYFKRGMSKEVVINSYNYVSLEQDELSPHRYLTNEIKMLGTIPSGATDTGFTVNPGDVVVDLGVAEGNFAFSVIDLASKIYLFECDPGWIRALEATFRNYSDKVVIVSKYVSDIDDAKNVSLDTYFAANERVNFIKMDVEGYEWSALQGMKKTLTANPDLRAAVCTYHYPLDSENFSIFFQERGFEISFSRGYMLFNMYEFDPPHLRKGVLRAKKKIILP
jgi:hypothetical protein